ncbi:hypothetical protein HYS82_00050 [Candidatus Amesbacteria bacterium]|nr:hypothetical protein [Candidatus Amesbacteria bacterium]
MLQTVNVTDFRNNLFEYIRLIDRGYEFEVEKAGRKVFKTVKVVDDWATRAGELYKLMKKWGGKFPDWKYSRTEFRDNKAEKEYLKRMEELWN